MHVLAEKARNDGREMWNNGGATIFLKYGSDDR